jgi:hypothetical protein
MTSRRTIAPLLTLILLFLMLIPAQAQTTSFRLGLPNEATLKRNLVTDLATFNWTPLTAATEYRLWVFHISDNARFGTILNEIVATGNCSTTNCAYTLDNDDRAQFVKGEYAWTVEATTSGGTVEASNGPRYFKYNPESVEFVTNGGFETGKTNPWIVKKLNADRVVVDAALAYSGSAAWFFKGSVTENSTLVQSWDVAYYNIQPSDVVTLSFAYNASGSGLNGRIRVNVVYADGTTKKEIKTLPAAASYTVVTEVIELTKTVKTLKVTMLNKSLKNADKIYIDDVSLLLSGSVIRDAALAFPSN